MTSPHFCSECGTALGEGTRFCPGCGAAVAGAPPAPPTSATPPPGTSAGAPGTSPGMASPPPGPPPTSAGTPTPPVSPGALPTGWATPPPPGGRKPGSVPLLIALSAALVVALAAGALVLTRDGDDTGDEREEAQGGDAEEGEVFLEPVSFRRDSFTGSVDIHNLRTTPTTHPVIPTTVPEEQEETAPSRGVPGNWPGLYGGTRDNASCDKEQLIGFLLDNPDKARAWAGVLDLDVDDIATYVRSLTPVILQRDTRVTNHGFRNGRATPLQAVLQAGTAVLIDAYGVPRVKCGCGNPLLEPVPTRATPVYTGDPWPTFTPVNIVNITVDVEVTNFVLVDVSGGEPFERPPGSDGDEDADVAVDSLCDLFPEDPSCGEPPPDEPVLGTGDVQVTLRWFSTADLDLAVVDPTGARIDYATRSSPSGGTLDVDSNGGCSGATSSPVENVFWPTGTAPDGEYRITVDYFDVCPGGEGPQAFELTLLIGGQAATVTPVSFVPGGPGQYEVVLAVADSHPEVPTPSGATGYAQVVEGTLDPGEEASFVGGKGPGYQPEEPEEPEETTPTTETGDSSGVVVDCSQYEEGTPMRVLCEHDPTSVDISAEDGGSLPVPVPEEPAAPSESDEGAAAHLLPHVLVPELMAQLVRHLP